MTKDETEKTENKTMITYFLSEDELYPLQKYDGQPEFSIFDKSQYNVKFEEEMPALTFHTNIGVNDLLPVPPEFTLVYQDVHWELEKWSIFRTLPLMMKYDQVMRNFFKGMANGTLKMPDFVNSINPPSLWAYYQTLPKWLRDHPIVRNVLMAFEYHKPTMSIRDKELALNYACSFIRPIDKAMEDVIIEVATSHKIRMNIALGKEMINELKFYEIDQARLGDTEDDEDGPKRITDESGAV